MKKSGINLVGVKEFNRSLILQMICTGREVTRYKLAKTAHLSSMTVTNVTTDLLSLNVIAETDSAPDAKSVGRSPKILTLAPHSPVVAGIWISKDFLYGAVSDMSLNLLYTKRVFFTPKETPDTILEKLGALTSDLTAAIDRPLLGLGIASIGVIDMVCGGIRFVTDFHNVQSLDIRDYLAERFHFPIFLANDMQASGLCELYFGHGHEEDNFLYVGISNGVGSAIVTNHQLLKNSVDSCGELGHMTIDYNGPKCSCGSRGCLELYVSSPNMLSQLSDECGRTFDSFAEAMDYCRVSSKAYSVLYNCSKQLTYALNSFINIIDISTIIFGHQGYYFPDEIMSSMESTLNRISVLKNSKQFRLLRSSFGENAPLYGSVCLVLEQLFNGNITLS